MATPAWVRTKRRVGRLTSKLIRTDLAQLATERHGVIDDLAPRYKYDDVRGVDGTVIRRSMSFADKRPASEEESPVSVSGHLDH